MKRIGIPEQSWCNKYARTVLKLKGLKKSQISQGLERQVSGSLKSFSTIYRAVAFDIDGTLTKRNSPEIDDKMSEVIAFLLLRGVPVLLISGRGRKSCRVAAESIARKTKLSEWYLRRLRCITHNGLIMLSTPTHSPGAFLREETVLSDPLAKIDEIHTLLCQSLSSLDLEQIPESTLEPCTGDMDPHSIRIAIGRSAQQRDEVVKVVKKILKQCDLKLHRPRIQTGSYGKVHSLDISHANKIRALKRYAYEIGVSLDQILRIGDQGQEGGNDYDLLNSFSGFSVSLLSNKPTCCLPILSDDLRTQLFGSKATRTLLERIMLFPRLSISKSHRVARIEALRSFEKIALQRSRIETQTVEQRLRVRLRYLLDDQHGSSLLSHLDASDIFDPHSGGVRLKDWELDEFGDTHPALMLFGLVEPRYKNYRSPKQKWCMFTDTSILMRGPNYYYPLVRRESEISKQEYLVLCLEFMTKRVARF
ncbi:MAG: HAD family phosphatase [bacterium]|nr:HAD family phosphatase [bacterium]